MNFIYDPSSPQYMGFSDLRNAMWFPNVTQCCCDTTNPYTWAQASACQTQQVRNDTVDDNIDDLEIVDYQ